MKKACAILTGDIEIRAFQPTCRTDDHWEAQQNKMDWLRELSYEHDCVIFDSGDLFDKRYKSNPSHKLINWAIENLPNSGKGALGDGAPSFYTVPGNHDLPGKSIDNYDNSAMAVLAAAGTLIRMPNRFPMGYQPHGRNINIYGHAWGEELKHSDKFNDKSINVGIIHAMVYEEFEPFPGCEGYSAKEVMDLLPDYDLILTGHNHQTFTLEKEGRVLVNPGSFMRNDADQEDHKPCVFLWYSETNTIKRVYIPIEQGVISRDHIDIKNAKETRLDAFVEKLGGQAVSGVNFHANLEAAVNDDLITKAVKDKIWRYYEGGYNEISCN